MITVLSVGARSVVQRCIGHAGIVPQKWPLVHNAMRGGRSAAPLVTGEYSKAGGLSPAALSWHICPSGRGA